MLFFKYVKWNRLVKQSICLEQSLIKCVLMIFMEACTKHLKPGNAKITSTAKHLGNVNSLGNCIPHFSKSLVFSCIFIINS